MMLSCPVVKTTVSEPEVVLRRGKPVSVILPIKEYEELLERLEDAADVSYLRSARKKILRYRSLESYLADRTKK
jgi:PHD/YefM family antitoxin component YafN of YafNO toxin-antitoxin module